MCVPPVFGCTDPSYDNYDATATIDDGSCANTYTLNMSDSWGDGWNGNGLRQVNRYCFWSLYKLQDLLN